jgi:D-sedoheptulose 7-phosphate isomerase
MVDYPQIISGILEESIRVKREAILRNMERIQKGAETLAACVSSGHKILIFGNGGSAADSQHIAAEFVNRFRIERPPLAALALTTDSSILTSIGNDYSFEDVFPSRWLLSGRVVAWGISTSGSCASSRCRGRAGLATIGMTGQGGKSPQRRPRLHRGLGCAARIGRPSHRSHPPRLVDRISSRRGQA